MGQVMPVHGKDYWGFVYVWRDRLRAWNKGQVGVQQYKKRECQHCGGTFNAGPFKHWHGDRCLKNPTVDISSRKNRKKKTGRPESAAHLNSVMARCEKCAIVTTRSNIARWHGPRCAPRRARTDVRARRQYSLHEPSTANAVMGFGS